MKNRFAVVTGGIDAQVVYQDDDRCDIYAWLRENMGGYPSDLEVVDRSTSTSWDELAFVREFEAQVAKAEAAEKHERLSEDRIRIIVRDEMSKLFEVMKETARDHARGLASYEVGELQRSAYSAFFDLIERVNEKS